MLISDLAQVLRVKAQEAPLIVLERLVRESCRQFCRKSLAWRIDFAGIISAGVNAYSFTQPVDSLVHSIIYAKLKKSNTNLEYLRDAGKAYVSPDYEASSGHTPQFVTLVDNDMFQLMPTPTLDDIIDIKVALTLPRTATVVDDALVEEFEDVLLDGALSRLFEMPNETWSNMSMAQYHLSKFLAGTEGARLRAQESRTPGVRVASFSW